MSEVFQQLEEKSYNYSDASLKPTCHTCNLSMKETILKTHYPRGVLPVRGFICPKCGYKVIGYEDAKEADETAERLGLLEPESILSCKINKIGDKLAVYIPAEIEQKLHLKQGTSLKIYTKGKGIIIEPVGPI